MTAQRFLILLVCLLAASSSLAGADSLQLRNGGHLQGKYVGGSATMIGFMTAGSIEYFPTSDVVSLIFDDNIEPSTNGLQRNRMDGDTSRLRFDGTAQKTNRHRRSANQRPSGPANPGS